MQTLTEYLLGLTPVQFNKNNKNNKSNGTQNANFKSADGKVIAQDKNQDGNKMEIIQVKLKMKKIVKILKMGKTIMKTIQMVKIIQ